MIQQHQASETFTDQNEVPDSELQARGAPCGPDADTARISTTWYQKLHGGQATYFSGKRCWISSTSSGRDAPSQGTVGKEKMTAAVCGWRLKRNSWMGSSTAFSLNLQIDYSDHGRLERSWATLAGGSCKWHLQGKDAHDHHNMNPKYQKVHIKMSQQELHEHIEQSYLVKYKHKAWNKTIWSKPPLSPYLACCWMQQPAENI